MFCGWCLQCKLGSIGRRVDPSVPEETSLFLRGTRFVPGHDAARDWQVAGACRQAVRRTRAAASPCAPGGAREQKDKGAAMRRDGQRRMARGRAPSCQVVSRTPVASVAFAPAAPRRGRASCPAAAGRAEGVARVAPCLLSGTALSARAWRPRPSRRAFSRSCAQVAACKCVP